mmetsp:Transcript_15466/g.38115  ORF Transcript_15466/g.38115 Transcript_15466/m.38115 type:complete len:212 (+) Transcript_15466:62-697(+)
MLSTVNLGILDLLRMALDIVALALVVVVLVRRHILALVQEEEHHTQRVVLHTVVVVARIQLVVVHKRLVGNHWQQRVDNHMVAVGDIQLEELQQRLPQLVYPVPLFDLASRRQKPCQFQPFRQLPSVSPPRVWFPWQQQRHQKPVLVPPGIVCGDRWLFVLHCQHLYSRPFSCWNLRNVPSSSHQPRRANYERWLQPCRHLLAIHRLLGPT